jgi:UDP-N-acetylmuramoyl-tripeptide--D-alanyl-D-alanine ligase
MKKLGKAFVLVVLSWQLKRLLKRNRPKIVGVVGSYGKTSTKLALATVLSSGMQVQYQDGNYNDIVTVPLIFFGEELPSLLNPFAWTALFMRNESKLRKQYPYDAVVLELGTDTPGNVAAFARYLKVDVAVVTSIAYEHMEFFADINAVAHEELAVQDYADELLVNADLCDEKYLKDLSKPVVTYAFKQDADYRAVDAIERSDRLKFTIHKHGKAFVTADCENSARAVQYSALVGAAVGEKFGLTAGQIEKGIANIAPAAGRMRRFAGINDVTILDDTYNASPEAVKAALDTLYASPIGPKFALLGNMNELGNFSPEAHTDVGTYCDPSQLDTVLTLGIDANKYTAEAARQNGCKVVEFTSPYAAGRWLADNMPTGAILLAKGSQNGVFAEEAVKLLLKDPADALRLVRQSPGWLKTKRRQFEDAV